jgi:hypothetical protein
MFCILFKNNILNRQYFLAPKALSCKMKCKWMIKQPWSVSKYYTGRYLQNHRTLDQDIWFPQLQFEKVTSQEVRGRTVQPASSVWQWWFNRCYHHIKIQVYI